MRVVVPVQGVDTGVQGAGVVIHSRLCLPLRIGPLPFEKVVAEADESLSVDGFDDIGGRCEADVGVERHPRFSDIAPFRRDGNDAVGGFGAVDGDGGGILQDVDALDVVRIDVGKLSFIDDAVEDVKGRRSRAEGVLTPDLDIRRTGRRGGHPERESGDAAPDRVGNRAGGFFLHLGRDELGDGPRQVFLPGGAVSDIDDGVQGLQVLFHPHDEVIEILDCHVDGDESDVGEGEDIPPVCLDGEVAVEVRDFSDIFPLLQDVHADERLPVCVGDLSAQGGNGFRGGLVFIYFVEDDIILGEFVADAGPQQDMVEDFFHAGVFHFDVLDGCHVDIFLIDKQIVRLVLNIVQDDGDGCFAPFNRYLSDIL